MILFMCGIWVVDWIIFYWVWWISWVLFVGVFIVCVLCGWMICEFIVGVFVVLVLLSFVWFVVLGGIVFYI